MIRPIREAGNPLTTPASISGPKPLVSIDVSLKSELKRIELYDGDNIRNVVSAFCKQNSLMIETEQYLYDKVKAHRK